MTANRRFGELAAAFVYLQSSSNTQAAYRSDLACFAEWCAGADPLASSSDDITSYRDACAKAGASASTVARRLSALSSFFEFAARTGVVAISPVRVAQSPMNGAKPTACLTPQEIDAFVAASAVMGAKTVALVHLLIFDGFKLGELLAADAADVVYLRQRVVAIMLAREADSTAIPLDLRTGRALSVYLAGRHTGPLLRGDSPTREPARLTRFGADYLIKKTSELAGLGRAVSSNVLRRTHVASAHAAGERIDQIQARLGHVDVRTTRRHLVD